MYWELELVTESQLGEVQMKPSTDQLMSYAHCQKLLTNQLVFYNDALKGLDKTQFSENSFIHQIGIRND